SLLERRLDNVITRLGFAASRPQARQMITHGHITVNGRKLDIPSYLIRPGDWKRTRCAGVAGPDQHRPARGARDPPARQGRCRLARDTSVDHRVVEPL